MKPIDEVARKIREYEFTRGGPFRLLIKQSLEWALEKMKNKSLGHYAEALIRERIELLEERQGISEHLGFAMKPARAAQINALRWVLDEGDLIG